MQSSTRRLVAAAGAALAVLVAAAVAFTLAGTARAAPSQVTLHLDGSHPLNDFHVGTFTASLPLCPAGSWQGHGNNTRTFTCADGTGTFLGHFDGILEHNPGVNGPWSVTSGTGKYVSLRGRGSGVCDSSAGFDEGSGPRPTFSDTWTGVVEFDGTAPTGSITSVKIVRSSTTHGLWRVKIAFRARDNTEGNSVAFIATAAADSFLTSRSGSVAGGTTRSFLVTFRPGARTRLLHVEIALSDQWGNQATIKKNVMLR